MNISVKTGYRYRASGWSGGRNRTGAHGLPGGCTSCWIEKMHALTNGWRPAESEARAGALAKLRR